MIAVDANILARFYVDDPGDPEAHRQRPIALRVMTGSSIFVPASVLLELEWVLRALYEFGPSDFTNVVSHLLGLPNVVIEAQTNVVEALDAQRDCSRLVAFSTSRRTRPLNRRSACTVISLTESDRSSASYS